MQQGSLRVNVMQELMGKTVVTKSWGCSNDEEKSLFYFLLAQEGRKPHPIILHFRLASPDSNPLTRCSCTSGVSESA